MKNDRINYLLVGSFVLTALVGLVVTLAVLSGRTGATESYYTVFDNVTGLVVGTQVLHEGYAVGTVQDIVPIREASKQRYKVHFNVEEGWAIPSDSLVEISAPGLLAAFTLEIKGGQSESLIPVGGEVPADNGPGILTLVSDVAGDISKLADESLRPLLEKLAESAPSILENVDSITVSLAEASRRVNSMLADEGDVQSILDNLEGTTRDLAATQGSVDQLLAALNDTVKDNRGGVDQSLIDLQHSLETVSRHIDAITQNLEGTSRNLYEFSRQVRRNPGVLLNGDTPVDEGGAGRQ